MEACGFCGRTVEELKRVPCQGANTMRVQAEAGDTQCEAVLDRQTSVGRGISIVPPDIGFASFHD